jgi:hypothetical protein
VNFFQPCFKLKSKSRQGPKVTKHYHRPATPYERLLADDRVAEDCKEQLRQRFAALDPVKLLHEIRQAQRQLSELELGASIPPEATAATVPGAELSGFVQSLTQAWRDGEVRATHRKRPAKVRTWRTHIDPFEKVWPVVEPTTRGDS